MSPIRLKVTLEKQNFVIRDDFDRQKFEIFEAEVILELVGAQTLL
jgi:hypothetical protein